MNRGRLNENQIKIIKNLFDNNPQLEIGVYKTFPFTPFILPAVVLSVFTQSSFLILCMC